MKFLSLTDNNSETALLKNEMSQARQIGKVYFGNEILFFKKGFKCFYIKYTEVYRAFRRIKAVPIRICCGQGELRLEYLVLCSKKNEIAEIDFPDERAITAAIEELQQKSPNTKIGKKE